MSNQFRKGFTLIELLVVIGIIAILAAIVIIAINPARQFAQARNTQRSSNVLAILNAVGQNLADNKGVFTCASGGIPTSTATTMATGTGSYYDVAQCLVPTYLSAMPYDPSAAGASWVSTTSYNTGYTITQSATTSRITVTAPSAELSTTISVTR